MAYHLKELTSQQVKRCFAFRAETYTAVSSTTVVLNAGDEHMPMEMKRELDQGAAQLQAQVLDRAQSCTSVPFGCQLLQLAMGESCLEAGPSAKRLNVLLATIQERNVSLL